MTISHQVTDINDSLKVAFRVMDQGEEAHPKRDEIKEELEEKVAELRERYK